jgi:glucosamine-phosphate N-acetyltransferase
LSEDAQVTVDFLDPEFFDLTDYPDIKKQFEEALTYKMMPLLARHLKNGFLETLACLKDVGLTEDEAFDIFRLRNKNKVRTYVCEMSDGLVIATASLIIEQKFIHKGGKVAHLEDFVVHEDYQGRGVGSTFMQYLEHQAIHEGCYKMILDCSDKVVDFYEKCGYIKHEHQMRKNLQGG